MHSYVLSMDDSLLYVHVRTADIPGEKMLSCHSICKKLTTLFWAPRADIVEMGVLYFHDLYTFAYVKQGCPEHYVNM